MPQSEHFDVVILGSGQGGKLLAWTLGRSGKTVAVVERRWVGGMQLTAGHEPWFVSGCSGGRRELERLPPVRPSRVDLAPSGRKQLSAGRNLRAP